MREGKDKGVPSTRCPVPCPDWVALWRQAPKHAMAIVLVLACFICVSVTDALAQGSLESVLKAEQSALDSLKAALEAEQARLLQTRRTGKTVARKLEQDEREIARIRGRLRDLKRREEGLSKRVYASRQEMVRVEGRLSDREAGMAVRAREMYKLGRRGGHLPALVTSGSFTEMLRLLKYLARVGDQDVRDYNAIVTDRRKLVEVVALRQTQHAHQQTLLDATRRSERQLGTRVTQREGELRRLHSDEKTRTEAIQNHNAAIEQSTARVAEIIKEMQARQRLAELPDFDFAGHRGRLQRPVNGPVLERFGRQRDPDLGTYTFNRGVNIGAAEGTEVAAVAPGEVVLVDWYPGYGQFVLLRHPGGYYSLYGHLSAVAVNVAEIRAEGSIIGRVGSTGRIDGTPQLHFEIMEGEEPLDPVDWLAE